MGVFLSCSIMRRASFLASFPSYSHYQVMIISCASHAETFKFFFSFQKNGDRALGAVNRAGLARRGRKRRKPYLHDGNLVVFRIPPELADSLRISDIDIKEVCIRALWEAVERGREGGGAESLGIDDARGWKVVGPPGFEPGTTSAPGWHPSPG